VKSNGLHRKLGIAAWRNGNRVTFAAPLQPAQSGFPKIAQQKLQVPDVPFPKSQPIQVITRRRQVSFDRPFAAPGPADIVERQ
jgi:hypothetical protein